MYKRQQFAVYAAISDDHPKNTRSEREEPRHAYWGNSRLPRGRARLPDFLYEDEMCIRDSENTKLKKLLAEAMLDNAMLKDIAAKKW